MHQLLRRTSTVIVATSGGNMLRIATTSAISVTGTRFHLTLIFETRSISIARAGFHNTRIAATGVIAITRRLVHLRRLIIDTGPITIARQGIDISGILHTRAIAIARPRSHVTSIILTGLVAIARAESNAAGISLTGTFTEATTETTRVVACKGQEHQNQDGNDKTNAATAAAMSTPLFLAWSMDSPHGLGIRIEFRGRIMRRQLINRHGLYHERFLVIVLLLIVVVVMMPNGDRHGSKSSINLMINLMIIRNLHDEMSLLHSPLVGV